MNRTLQASLVSLTFLAGATFGARAQSQPLQKGVSVQMAVTSGAVPVPDADNADSLIVTVTANGKLYSGINPINPSALDDELKRGLSIRKNKTLYIKADAHAPYTSVVEVLDAASRVGANGIVLLTSQPNASKRGTPEGLPLSLGTSN
jgi:biopolymer transport protein ExbD